MKYFLIICISLMLSACAVQQAKIPGTNLNQKIFDLEPVALSAPTLAYDSIVSEVKALDPYIGSYPPRFASEAQRETIYQKWLSLLAEAKAYESIHSGTEKSLALLSELYRQGHNLDVRSSAENAGKHIDLCLQRYPQSIPCHFSASYFYLSIGPGYLDKGEQSLSFLKQYYSPSLNPGVEAAYVFLHLYRQDVARARQQIDFFITKFPDSERAAAFADMKNNLGETIEVKNY